MEPILDEQTLIPTPATPGDRIQQLAHLLLALDRIGASRVIRTTRDAADRDLHSGRGLRTWCFDRDTNLEAGRLVASRLAKQPYIDGEKGLFNRAEGNAVVEAKVQGKEALGAGLAALTDAPLSQLSVGGQGESHSNVISVEVEMLDTEGASSMHTSEVLALSSALGVDAHLETLTTWVDRSLCTGTSLLEHAAEAFPRLRFGAQALAQMQDLNGNENEYRQVLRHLRRLDAAAAVCPANQEYAVDGISSSHESKATLHHARYGPMRDFPTPEGFEPRRFSRHTKLTGGAICRLYFSVDTSNNETVVLIGYLGRHLPTVKFNG